MTLGDRLSLLLDLGQEVVGALDAQCVVDAAARITAQTLGCCAYVWLPDGNGAALRLGARVDPDPQPGTEVGASLPLDVPSLSSLAFRDKRVHTSADNRSDPRVAPELVARFRCRCTAAVPLLLHGEVLGILAIFHRDGGREFDEQDLRVATHAAQLTAVAIENARLYSEQRARAEEMALLNDVARRLAGSLDWERLLELGGETLRRLLESRDWSILLPEEGGLRIAASSVKLDGVLLGYDEPSVAAAAFRERRVVQVLDPVAEASMVSHELVSRLGNRPILAVPLIAREQVLGVVVVSGHDARLCSQVVIDRALAVAGELALALLSARLYEDLRQSYAELAQAQADRIDRERLVALGELSASIAHEVRNPLGVIFNSVGSLRRLLKPSGDVALLLDIVGEEADRLNRMVGDLLDYSRPLRLDLQPVALGATIEDAVGAARNQIGPAADSVKVVVRLAPDAATVRADGRLLRQAFVNLFLNAYQAMPRNGTLTVRSARDGELAGISVHDSGSGIPPEVRHRIFQPFFTTKAMGTGLGLAVVKRIAEGHGGTVTLAAAQRGTEFVLRLPLIL